MRLVCACYIDEDDSVTFGNLSNTDGNVVNFLEATVGVARAHALPSINDN